MAPSKSLSKDRWPPTPGPPVAFKWGQTKRDRKKKDEVDEDGEDVERARRRMAMADFADEGDEEEEDAEEEEGDEEEEDEDMKRARRRMAMADFADEGDEEVEGEGEEDDDAKEEEEGEEEEEEEDEDMDMYYANNDDDAPVDSEEEEEEEEESDEEEDEPHSTKPTNLNRLQEQLADVPFDLLLQAQQTIGLKKFKQMRENVVVRRPDEEPESDDSDDSEPENNQKDKEDEEESGRRQKKSGRGTTSTIMDSLRKHAKYKVEKEKKEKKKFVKPKRTNKHAPAEVTSKKPVSRFRKVIEDTQPKSLDPRFNPLSGTFNPGLFKTSYSFLQSYEKSELQQLRDSIKKLPANSEKRIEMERELQRRLSRKMQKEKEEKVEGVKREWKKKELEAVKNGKKPYFLKKGDVKKLTLVNQYKNMSAAQVDKLLEKRRKKNSASEKRYMPYQRRSG
ncbi:hypothetical protein HDV05_006648 [Chytridiales sp. JEL 0842]|nr:hypothetical protein HDV05_006648 [Chytridiales sp. JEL 0842]